MKLNMDWNKGFKRSCVPFFLETEYLIADNTTTYIFLN